MLAVPVAVATLTSRLSEVSPVRVKRKVAVSAAPAFSVALLSGELMETAGSPTALKLAPVKLGPTVMALLNSSLNV